MVLSLGFSATPYMPNRCISLPFGVYFAARPCSSFFGVLYVPSVGCCDCRGEYSFRRKTVIRVMAAP
jgi:hypothetical protein